MALNLEPKQIIEVLQMSPHPEGGYFKETYRDGDMEGGRAHSTAIYFLIEAGNYSRLHRIDAAEGWHFYAGDPLEVIELSDTGPIVTRLGIDFVNGSRPQHIVHKNRWFGARVAEGSKWSLVGCTVAPAFEFSGFEMGIQSRLLKEFPSCKDVIRKLTPQE